MKIALLMLVVLVLTGCSGGWTDSTTIRLRDGTALQCFGGVLFTGDYVECHIVKNANFAKHTIYLVEVLSISRTESK